MGLEGEGSGCGRRKYHYVGETLDGRRHGWGRLLSDDRLIYEGCWQHGRALGHYIAYHEFHVEMGFQSAWHRVAIFILGDAHGSVVPVALDRYPLVLRGEKRSSALLQRSECLARPDESLLLTHGDCKKIPHNTVAPSLWLSQTSTISKSFEWDKQFDTRSQVSAASEFLPRKKFTRMPTTLRPDVQRRVDTGDGDGDTGGGNGDRGGGGGEPEETEDLRGLTRSSSNESSSTEQSTTRGVLQLGHSMSLAGSNYSCKASSTDAGSTIDYSAVARQFPINKDKSQDICAIAARSCPCRRGSYPAAVPTNTFSVTLPSLASLSSPDGHRECPIKDQIDTRWHRRVLASLHHAASGNFRAADFANWTNAHICLFLAAVGAYAAVGPFRKHKITGNTVQRLNMKSLERIGITDAHTRRFLIAIFRYLWNGVDWGDPLTPPILKSAIPLDQPPPPINVTRAVLLPASCIMRAFRVVAHWCITQLAVLRSSSALSRCAFCILRTVYCAPCTLQSVAMICSVGWLPFAPLVSPNTTHIIE